MKRIMAALSLGLVASMAAAKDITVEVEGKTVTVQATTTNREIVEKDIVAGDQKTPLGCSLLYYARLAKGEIAEASTLSTDPKATVEKWEQYKQRLGGEEFKKEMEEFEREYADEQALVSWRRNKKRGAQSGDAP